MRQLDILGPDELKPTSVTVVGCGGIGSAACLFLAKMGIPKFVLYDADIIQEHNIANQMFPRDAINKHKVEVVADEIRRMSPRSKVTVTAHFERVDTLTVFDTPIVISCLDSMESRVKTWSAVKDSMCAAMYIDARMGAEVAKVYTVRPMDENTKFYTDSLVQGNHTTPCTAQAIAYNVGLISAIIGSNVRRFLTNLSLPRLIIGDSLNLQFIRMCGES